jgi:ABC-2 type transport system permease protein
MNARRLLAVVRKEFIHVIRDWRSLYLAIAIPIILICLFGWALNMDLSKVPTVIWDQSHSPESRELISDFDGSPYFSVTRFFDNYRDLTREVDSARAMVAIVIPWDFADRIRSEKPVTLQAILEGSDANNASLALGYVNAIGLIFNQKILVERIQAAGGHPPGMVELAPRAWYNADLKSRNVIVPGIIAMVMVVIAAMLTSVTVAREWEMGTMEQLISTPIKVPELVLGKVVPYFVIGMVDVAIAMSMGYWIFDVPLRGSTGLVFAAAALFLTGALFFGLTLSIVLKSQVLANQLALFGSYLPTLLLSGFVFGIHNMPAPIRAITYIVPARYFIAMLKGIYLKGIGLEILWTNAVLLALYAAVMVAAAHAKMRLKLQ